MPVDRPKPLFTSAADRGINVDFSLRPEQIATMRAQADADATKLAPSVPEGLSWGKAEVSGMSGGDKALRLHLVLDGQNYSLVLDRANKKSPQAHAYFVREEVDDEGNIFPKEVSTSGKRLTAKELEALEPIVRGYAEKSATRANAVKKVEKYTARASSSGRSLSKRAGSMDERMAKMDKRIADTTAEILKVVQIASGLESQGFRASLLSRRSVFED